MNLLLAVSQTAQLWWTRLSWTEGSWWGWLEGSLMCWSSLLLLTLSWLWWSLLAQCWLMSQGLTCCWLESLSLAMSSFLRHFQALPQLMVWCYLLSNLMDAELWWHSSHRQSRWTTVKLTESTSAPSLLWRVKLLNHNFFSLHSNFFSQLHDKFWYMRKNWTRLEHFVYIQFWLEKFKNEKWERRRSGKFSSQ